MLEKNRYDERKAYNNTTAFIKDLIYNTEKQQMKWQCLNHSIDNYNYSVLNQEYKIIKYVYQTEKGGISSIYVSQDTQNDDYNLEVEFADNRGIMCEIPLENGNENCKRLIRDLCESIQSQIEIGIVNEINSHFQNFAQSLSDE